MSIRQILSLKQASIQTRIDAISARENAIAQKLDRLSGQGDGLGLGKAEAGFQIAAMAASSARNITAQLTQDRSRLREARLLLAREKLSLDLADRKLELEEQKIARLDASRAADRA